MQALMCATAGHRVECACMLCEAVREIERLRLREQQLKTALDEMYGLTKQLYDVAVRA